MEEDQTEIRVRLLIDLFENRSPKKQKVIDETEESADITRHIPREAFVEETIFSTPGRGHLHHTTQETDTTRTSFALPLQTNHVKNGTEERIVQVHRTTHELTNRDAPIHKDVPDINRIRELEESLKMRQYENDRLRNDLNSVTKKLESMELTNEKLKKDHEVQRRESAIQLNGMNKKLDETVKQLNSSHWEKDELKVVKDELVKEKLSNSNYEKRLNETNAKLAELLKQMGQKDEQLLRKNDNSGTEKIAEELDSERLLKFELVKKLSTANERISTLERQLEDLKKQDYKDNSAYKQMLQTLSSEKRLRMESETRLNEMKKELDGELQLRQTKSDREKVIAATLAELSEEKQARIEQEKLLNATKHRCIALGKQLEQVENELEKTKKQLAKERLAKRNQEKLLSDANRKLSGLCDMLDEKQKTPTLNGDERDQMRVFGDEILFISPNKQALSANFPEVPSSSQPLVNLHAGSQRPKRKKNHSPLSPIITGAPDNRLSHTDSDSDDLIAL